ncbi:hypothetical protein [Caloranaerobacter azorensis]|uniref:Uncharacterized protein n=2 Tax=Caloranaerobacter azorensis TaxID=116090 RepID=A0A1M5R405_9FIRM|nr:hypothetical protein [Caloranaerobacter azorensis]QIB26905.1 hypothetical protein G3A45_06120 [Caloranaerobacter azorensis]SHH20503.1 hypothetical protein SAMN02745135_00047 [Caloranaerobacter azorensis DSM 13643]
MIKNKKYLIVLIAFTFLIIFYEIPMQVDKSYQGYLYVQDKDDAGEVIDIRLKGKLTRNILTQNVFEGVLMINNKQLSVSSLKAGNLRVALEMKFKMNYYTLISRDEYGNTVLLVDVSKDFDLISGSGDFHKIEDRFSKELHYSFEAPALNRKEAVEVSKKIKRYINKS